MKKILLLGFIFSFLGNVQAETSVPLSDSLLCTGRLSNGLTYYIRQNPASDGYAGFYLVQNIGALLEEDTQNGLAHFLEHMAFNGSRHFPGKSMIRMLERHGVTLTQGINAYTSLNETLYGLDHVPVGRNRLRSSHQPGENTPLLDTCLLILHDWSHFLNLDSQAMETERPVILEEWRTRRDADFRLNSQIMPVTLRGSQYAVRDIIGDTAVIRNFHPNELRTFYRTWYRPDLQAIIVVGDIDILDTEQKIKTLFADIPESRNALSRPFFEIPLKDKFSFVQATDREASRVRIRIRTMQKSPVESDTGHLKEELQTNLFNCLIRERLYEMFRRRNIPALAYSLVRHDAQRGYRSLTLTLIPRPGDEEKVLKAALEEKERVKRYGFTAEELQRAQRALIREAETACLQQNKQPDGFYIEKLSRHFLDNKPILSASAYLEFIRRELPLYNSETVSRKLVSWDDGSNYIVSVTGPDSMSRLDSANVRQLILSAGEFDLSPYEEKTSESLSLPKGLAGGKIIKETFRKSSGAREWILSNGIKVIFKPTSTGQRISLLAFREGGTAGCRTEDLLAAFLLPALVNNYGLGNLNALQFDKFLSAKDISSGVTIRPAYEALSGEAPFAELETLMQIVWMRVERPRFDSTVHQGVLNSQKARWSMRSRDLFQRINDTLIATLGNYHPRVMPIRQEQFDAVSLQQVEQLYREKFGDMAGFTFIITGNGEEQQVRKLVEKYIGSLPVSGKQKRTVGYVVPLPDWKIRTKIVQMPFTEHQSTVILHLTAALDYSLENEYDLDVLRGLLELYCMKELREKDGAVYSVSVQKDFEVLPLGKASLMVSFACAPGREKELSGRVNGIFRLLATEGPEREDLQKVVKNLKTRRQLLSKDNQYWISGLFYRSLYGVDKTDDTYSEQLYSRISPASCRDFFRKFQRKACQTELFFQPR